ncbi:uncharacterized protein N7483_008041 [Penicillium malachiteum]|uniref:uncharacterized protein n=1 Tax=Penicillium malachiteum TaxID=1324776 RepID=UPI00254951A0|nr:uncharacterized protein N7483_008041 [Penicillium malachiteum]KAJ5726684.1 hypothetical protein N7483_008041 [Penicillium malachiteum]
MASMSFGNNYGFQVGISNGPISATFLAPVERPETPPSPLSTVPFPQDPDFVGRDALLQRIREKAAAPGSAVALIGLGGVGKTQLAIEYPYQIRREQPDTWVFWVHASNPDRFKESFCDIADQAKIPGRKGRQVYICSLVRNWLRNGVKEKWVLILDNIDDDVLLRGRQSARSMKTQATSQGNTSSTHPLLGFIPRTSNGTLIATSRNRKIALELVAHDDIIMVEPMTRSEASQLLQKKLSRKERPQRQRAYSKINPAAVSLLSLMSFFDLQGVSESLLRGSSKKTAINSNEDEDSMSETDADQDFEDDITVLRDYSLIFVTENGMLFALHRLVQHSVQRWLKVHA